MGGDAETPMSELRWNQFLLIHESEQFSVTEFLSDFNHPNDDTSLISLYLQTIRHRVNDLELIQFMQHNEVFVSNHMFLDRFLQKLSSTV